MEIKIQLPNPDEYQYHRGVADWFSQMRICLKAAEKTYQEAVKGLTDKEDDEPTHWVEIDVPYELQDELIKGSTPDGETSVHNGRTTSEFIHGNLYIRVWSA